MATEQAQECVRCGGQFTCFNPGELTCGQCGYRIPDFSTMPVYKKRIVIENLNHLWRLPCSLCRKNPLWLDDGPQLVNATTQKPVCVECAEKEQPAIVQLFLAWQASQQESAAG